MRDSGEPSSPEYVPFSLHAHSGAIVRDLLTSGVDVESLTCCRSFDSVGKDCNACEETDRFFVIPSNCFAVQEKITVMLSCGRSGKSIEAATVPRWAMKSRLLKMFDTVLGVADQSIEERVTKLSMGIVIPLFPILYGISSVLSGESAFIGRHGVMSLSGSAAVAAGVAYLAFGMFVHVHYCWEHHPALAGLADAAGRLLLIVAGLALAFTFVGVLI